MDQALKKASLKKAVRVLSYTVPNYQNQEIENLPINSAVVVNPQKEPQAKKYNQET